MFKEAEFRGFEKSVTTFLDLKKQFKNNQNPSKQRSIIIKYLFHLHYSHYLLYFIVFFLSACKIIRLQEIYLYPEGIRQGERLMVLPLR